MKTRGRSHRRSSRKRDGKGVGVAGAKRIQQTRSEHAKAIDAAFKAPIAETPAQWAANPNRLDYPKIDAAKTGAVTRKKGKTTRKKTDKAFPSDETIRRHFTSESKKKLSINEMRAMVHNGRDDFSLSACSTLKEFQAADKSRDPRQIIVWSDVKTGKTRIAGKVFTSEEEISAYYKNNRDRVEATMIVLPYSHLKRIKKMQAKEEAADKAAGKTAPQKPKSEWLISTQHPDTWFEKGGVKAGNYSTTTYPYIQVGKYYDSKKGEYDGFEVRIARLHSGETLALRPTLQEAREYAKKYMGIKDPDMRPVDPKRWRLRDINKMTDEELQTYWNRMEKGVRKFSPRERDRKLLKEMEAVEILLHNRKTAEQERVLSLARAGTLTFSTTPMDNPFPFEYGGYYGSGNRPVEYDNTRHNTIQPFVEAKEATIRVMDIMKSYGYERAGLSQDAIFSDYVKHYQQPYSVRGDDPYTKILEIRVRADEVAPEVKNIVESSAFKDKKNTVSKETVIKKFKTEDQYAVKAALNNVAQEEGWKLQGSSVILNRDKVSYAPDLKGLQALRLLGVFSNYHGDDTGIMVNIEGGRAKVRVMNASRTSAFYGEVDVSKVPKLRSAEGNKVLMLPGGDAIAFNNPDLATVNGEGLVILKKHDVTKTTTQYEGDSYLDREKKLVKTKVTKEFAINLADLQPSEKDDYEIPRMPNLKHTNTFTVDVNELDKAIKPDKKGVNDYGDTIKFYSKHGKTLLVRRADREGVGEDRSEWAEPKVFKRHLVVKTAAIESSGPAQCVYGLEYFRDMVKIAKANGQKTLKISYDTNMPLRTEFDTPAVKGEYYLAPRIETD